MHQNHRDPLHSRGVSPERQYLIYGELFDEYQPFNYGKAVEALEKQKEIALSLGDKSRLNDVHLKEAMLNTAAGEFLEVRNNIVTPSGQGTQRFPEAYLVSRGLQ